MYYLLHTLIILLAGVEMTTAGRFKVRCKEEQVTAKAGEDDVIQCWFYSRNKASSVAFIWRKADAKGIIYNYTMSHSSLGEQDLSYRDRAEVFDSEIPKGNVSLRLKNVTLSDSGIYRLSVASRSQSTGAQVFLSIRALGTRPVIRSSSDDLSLLVLVCESSGWYPAPSVTWENGLGENLTRYSHTELTNCMGSSVCVKSTLEMDNWPTGNYTCIMWDQELDEGLWSTFTLIHRVPLGTVIGATGASVCAFILIVAVFWSWW
ncbi:V-set domain-containing T-cell activation inhibitor 1-like [Heterodontus francisci]|uniref:V-set domain-containing T-cell activation inhibitor 1-like n=1 Tax=Heterodontus francisci TaxID=7792 RepID=UPI00355B02B2